ncbi:metallophosphoesterase [Alkaliphilus pronyensis]|uniref:Metallophosphoesterase n=1 Tax=Alkaliphilus pronyensis TaxID=1482732 RepID=A0A6I0FRA1_9FIRM|nr:metallophosphoesterase [Alkaliphilus pronyensis]KAB3540988.1 metallophosphoesterase [Alkaliphilus pronyensis]
MNIINRIKEVAYSLTNYPYIPEEFIKEAVGPMLIHISDTPSDIYTYIYRVIEKVKPKYIIHTGDLVDDIKLEILKGFKDEYYKNAKKLIKRLDASDAITYYALGNHDDHNIVTGLTDRGIVIEKATVEIESLIFHLNHYHEDNNEDKDFYLFGHGFYPAHYNGTDFIGLNGLLNINIIDLSTKKVYQLKYPIGTNRLRRMELGRIGI